MNSEFNRRRFIRSAAITGLTGCALLFSAKLNPSKAFNFLPENNEIPDPKTFNYCGYKCPEDCQMLKGTRDNNIELKKTAYNNFKIKEKYGVEFDENQIFCWGCKTKDKPEGLVISKCQVKKCVIDKGLDCCIECNDLTKCDFEIWKTFPDFHKSVIEMQKIFMVSRK